MLEPVKTELCFLEVPAPQSGHVVEQLQGAPGIAAVAAVYSGVDVVAVLEGTAEEIAKAYEEIAPERAPNIESYESFPAEDVIFGRSAATQEGLLTSACMAFVRCAIRTDEVTVPWAAKVLATLPGVIKLFPSAKEHEIVLQVVAPDKKTFDDAIMSAIQGQWSVVRSTRTYLAINGMQWHREAREKTSAIFISTATSDLPLALWLGERIRKDTGLPSWTYKDIAIGTAFWTQSIDEAIEAAPFHVFLLSKAALASDECQREFGRAEAVDSGNICCLLLPDCTFEDLPTRYQQRQCLSAADFLAYPQLLDWIHSRLRNSE
jgi:hypothetical protein